MRLQINTNGAWRTVLNSIGQHSDPKAAADQLRKAKEAAATLARIDASIVRKPISWRLVGEDGAVIERCDGEGWVQAMDRRAC